MQVLCSREKNINYTLLPKDLCFFFGQEKKWVVVVGSLTSTKIHTK